MGWERQRAGGGGATEGGGGCILEVDVFKVFPKSTPVPSHVKTHTLGSRAHTENDAEFCAAGYVRDSSANNASHSQIIACVMVQ